MPAGPRQRSSHGTKVAREVSLPNGPQYCGAERTPAQQMRNDPLVGGRSGLLVLRIAGDEPRLRFLTGPENTKLTKLFFSENLKHPGHTEHGIAVGDNGTILKANPAAWTAKVINDGAQFVHLGR